VIGLVIVSHSRPLAQALEELVRQVASDKVAIAIAAGVGPEHQEFGTDAIEIHEAIQTVYSDDGVLVLMDLGSAVLSAQMAVELLPPEMQPGVRFCSAPLVEGAIAAAVQASLGSDLDTACGEARQSLIPKREQLGEPVEDAASAPLADVADTADKICVEHALRNTYGLHARPAARFVQAAAGFEANIQVRNLTNGKGPVSAKSLNGLATLGAVQNHRIEICAAGPQAEEAVELLSEMILRNFDESTEPPPAAVPAPAAPAETPQGALEVVPIAEGYALALLASFETPPPPIPAETPATEPHQEWDSLQTAISQVRKHIHSQKEQIKRTLGADEAAIFDAHLLILEDPEIITQVRERIFEHKTNAARAWYDSLNHTADLYRELEDAYLQQRAADVLDVRDQVLFTLAGEQPAAVVKYPAPVLLAAEELTPSQTSQLDLEHIQGLITVVGGPTSHSAILARSLGLPAVSGAPLSLLDMPADTVVGLDGERGLLWLNPPEETRQELLEKRLAWLQKRQRLLEQSRQPGQTRDGHRVEIAANTGNLADAQSALKNGAEGIGLLRTEFLFLTRMQPPDEEEQRQALERIAQAMDSAPVIVRTLDVGGDKPLPYIDLPAEDNPFLGVRAIRLTLQQPELFTTQLRAILRAGATTDNLKIMFPMISGKEEIIAARQLLEAAHQALEQEGLPHQWPIETGIMVEVPSAAVIAPRLAEYVDFFSIGTNDLTQYTLAAERGSASLAAYSDALHPAVINLVYQVTQAALAHDRWTGVCGELAGDPQAIPILVGLGVNELSMNPGSIPRAKAVLRQCNLPDMQNLARQALVADTTRAVRRLAAEFLDGLDI
jgi:phosphocarrier protein FPr